MSSIDTPDSRTESAHTITPCFCLKSALCSCCHLLLCRAISLPSIDDDVNTWQLIKILLLKSQDDGQDIIVVQGLMPYTLLFSLFSWPISTRPYRHAIFNHILPKNSHTASRPTQIPIQTWTPTTTLSHTVISLHMICLPRHQRAKFTGNVRHSTCSRSMKLPPTAPKLRIYCK